MSAGGAELEGAEAPTNRVGVVLPAAGEGRRMGGARKAYLELSGTPLLVHALRPFLARDDVVAVGVALPPGDAQAPPPWLTGLDARICVVAGGSTRQDSVRNAVDALPDDVAVIAVHDAARPLVDTDLIERCVRLALGGSGAVAGVPASDTLKEVDADAAVVRTLDRSRVWHAQTPQVFPAAILRAALARAAPGATDDAQLVEGLGTPVRMVPAGSTNLKVTRPEDLRLAEAILAGRSRP